MDIVLVTVHKIYTLMHLASDTAEHWRYNVVGWLIHQPNLIFFVNFFITRTSEKVFISNYQFKP